MRENRERITRVSSDEARRLKGETDYARLDSMTDDDIAKAVANDPDAPPLDVDWDKANIVIPPGKDIITLRLDRDLLDYLRAQGKGYQTLINQVLRAWYDAQIKRGRLTCQPSWRPKNTRLNSARRNGAKWRPGRKSMPRPPSARRKRPPPSPQRQPKSARDRARNLKPEERPMVDERPQMAASEIEEELLAELQKLPTLHDTQSVTIRPFSGPQGWTWELDRIEPEVGPEQSKFADVTNVVARLQQQFDLDPSV